MSTTNNGTRLLEPDFPRRSGPTQDKITLGEVSDLAPVLGPDCFRVAKECLLDVFLRPMTIKSGLSEIPPEADGGPFVPGRSDGSFKIQTQFSGLPVRPLPACLQESADPIRARRSGDLLGFIFPP